MKWILVFGSGTGNRSLQKAEIKMGIMADQNRMRTLLLAACLIDHFKETF